MISKDQIKKYLYFFLTEAEKYKEDLEISEHELAQLQIELNRFRELLNESDRLSNDLKDKCLALKFDYSASASQINKMLVVFGKSRVENYQQQQEEKRLLLDNFRNDIQSILRSF